MKARLITWQEFYSVQNRLIQQVQASGEAFEYVLAVAKGGVFPAYYIAKALNIPIVTINLKSYDGQNQGILEPLSVPGAALDLAADTPGIIVDDIYDSGQTGQYLKAQFPYLKLACLYARWGDHPLDFVGGILGDEQWVDFPWEVQFDGTKLHHDPL